MTAIQNFLGVAPDSHPRTIARDRRLLTLAALGWLLAYAYSAFCILY